MVNTQPARAAPGVATAASATAATAPPPPPPPPPSRVTTFLDHFAALRSRLDRDEKLSPNEVAMALSEACARPHDPATGPFLDACLVRTIDIFLSQNPFQQPQTFLLMEDVLRTTVKIILNELVSAKSIRRIDVLGRLFDNRSTFYGSRQGNRAAYRSGAGGGTSQEKSGMALRESLIVMFGTSSGYEVLKNLIADPTGLTGMDDATTPLIPQASIATTATTTTTSPKPPPPTTIRILRQLIAPISFSNEMMERKFLDDVLTNVLAQIEQMDDDTFKKTKPEDLAELMYHVVELMADDVSKQQFMRTLALRALKQNDVFLLKKFGLEQIVRACAETKRMTNMNILPRSSNYYSGAAPSNTNGIFDDEKMCIWIRENDVFKHIFGREAQTHSVLVARSKALLDYVATAGFLENNTISMMFDSCLGQHESEKGAVYALLGELVLDLGSKREHSSVAVTILKHAKTLLSTGHEQDLSLFLQKMFAMEASTMSWADRCANTTEEWLDLLWQLLTATDVAATAAAAPATPTLAAQRAAMDPNHLSREALVHHFIRILYRGLTSPYHRCDTDLLIKYISQAAGLLKGSSDMAIMLLRGIIEAHPSRHSHRSESEYSQEDVTAWLQEKQIVDLAVDDICRFCAANPLGNVKPRCDFLIFLLRRLPTGLFTFEQVDKVKRALADRPSAVVPNDGEGDDDDDDDISCWLSALVSDADGNVESICVLSDEVVTRVFAEIVCAPQSNLSFLCFAKFFLRANLDQNILKGELASDKWIRVVYVPPRVTCAAVLGFSKLWELALCSSPATAELAAFSLLSLLLQCPEPSQRNDFFQRVFTVLSTESSSSSSHGQAVRLLDLFLATSPPLVEDTLPAAASISTATPQHQHHLCEIHHDQLFLHSKLDVGKLLERKFNYDNGTFRFLTGCVLDYDAAMDKHSVMYQDGTNKWAKLSTIDFIPRSEHVAPQDKVVRVISRNQASMNEMLRLVSKMPQAHAEIVNAFMRYEPIRVTPPFKTWFFLKSEFLRVCGSGKGLVTPSTCDFEVWIPPTHHHHPQQQQMSGDVYSSAARWVPPPPSPGLPADLLRHCVINRESGGYRVQDELREIPFAALNWASPATTGAATTVMTIPNEITPGIDVEDDSWSKTRVALCPNHNFFWASKYAKDIKVVPTATTSDGAETAAATATATPETVPTTSPSQPITTTTTPITFPPSHHAKLVELLRSPDAMTRKFAWSCLMRLPVLSSSMATSLTNKTFAWNSEMSHAVTKEGINLVAAYALHVLELVAESTDPTLANLGATSASPTPQQVCRFLFHAVTEPLPDDLGVSVAVPILIRVLLKWIALTTSSPFSPSSDGMTNELSIAAAAVVRKLGLDQNNNNDSTVVDALSILDILHREDGPATDKPTIDVDFVSVLARSPSREVRNRVRDVLMDWQTRGKASVFEAVSKVLRTRIAPYAPYCHDFFDFLVNLVETGAAREHVGVLFETVQDRLVQYTNSGMEEDCALLGLLDLGNKLVSGYPALLELARPMCEVLVHNFIICLPTRDRLGMQAVATAKSTRQACFTLLEALTSRDATLYRWLTKELESFVEATQIPTLGWGGGKRWEFAFKPDDSRKDTSGYVGLVNQGATCYQNSVLQQLFMLRDMRELVLRAGHEGGATTTITDAAATTTTTTSEEITTAAKNSNLFRALQKTFTFLSTSEQRCWNPISFVKSSSVLKLQDGHMSQNDAVEFFGLLVEYLETHFASNTDKNRFKSLFYFNAEEVRVRRCEGNHKTISPVTPNPYYHVTVRDKSSLVEALDSDFQAEKADGLECEECINKDEKKKKDRFEGDKIKYFTRLPPVLVIQLNRFDFDYETGLPLKLNHRIEFERELDLAKYTKEVVMARFEGREAPEVDARYHLHGVVVHHGTSANFGHYYSFIEDPTTKQWFRFDDDRVTPFDYDREVELECFGGPLQAVSQNEGKMGTKSSSAMSTPNASKWGGGGTQGGGIGGGGGAMMRTNNAYILVYRKVEQPNAKVQSNLLPQASYMSLMSSSVAAGGGGDTTSVVVPMTSSTQPKISMRIALLTKCWRRRARIAMEAKERARSYEKEVWEDNLRALRHSIAFAPDFLAFCLQFAKAGTKHEEDILDRQGAADHQQQGTRRVSVAEVAAVFIAKAFLKIALFAASERKKLNSEWLGTFRKCLAACASEHERNAVCRRLIEYQLLDPNSPPWLERLLGAPTVTGGSGYEANEAPSQHFEEFVGTLITNLRDEGTFVRFADTLLMLLGVGTSTTTTTTTASTAAATTPMTSPIGAQRWSSGERFFGVMQRLCDSQAAKRRFLDMDAVVHLHRLLCETSAGHFASGDGRYGEYNNHFSDSKDILERIVQVLSKLLLGNTTTTTNSSKLLTKPSSSPSLLADIYDMVALENTVTDDCLANLSGNSQTLVLSQNFLDQIVRVAPGAGKRLVSRLCQVKGPDAGKEIQRCLDNLLKTLSCCTIETLSTGSQQQVGYASAGSTMHVPTHVLKDAIDCILELLLVDLDNKGVDTMARLETNLVRLVKLAKEAKTRYGQRRDHLARLVQSGYHQMYWAQGDEQSHSTEFCVYLIAKLFADLSARSDAALTCLSTAIKFSWMLPFVDEFSYQPYARFSPKERGGFETLGTRHLTFGRDTRDLVRALARCNQLASPLPLFPTNYLAYSVERVPNEFMGLYLFDGFFEPGTSEQVDLVTPKFLHVDPESGLRVHMYRCMTEGNNYTWYISHLSEKPGTNKDTDYFASQGFITNHGRDDLPTDYRWSVAGKKVKQGVPHLVVIQDVFEVEDVLEHYRGVGTVIR